MNLKKSANFSVTEVQYAAPRPNDTSHKSHLRDSYGQQSPRCLRLIKPQMIFDFLLDILSPFRYLLLTLAILITSIGCFVAIRHYDALSESVISALKEYGLIGRIIFTFLTINLATQIFKGLVARHFRLSTPSFGVGLGLGLFPRFSLEIEPATHTSRKARLWLSSSSIQLRIFFFGGGVFLWFLAASSKGLSSLAALVAVVALIGLAFSANPFFRSEAATFLAALLEIPGLREKSQRRFWSIFSRKPTAVARHNRSSPGMVIFGLCSILLIYAFFGFIAYRIFWSLERSFQGFGVALAITLFIYIFIMKNVRSNPIKHKKNWMVTLTDRQSREGIK